MTTQKRLLDIVMSSILKSARMNEATTGDNIGIHVHGDTQTVQKNGGSGRLSDGTNQIARLVRQNRKRLKARGRVDAFLEI